MTSKTQEAIAWLVANPGSTQGQAALMFGLTQSAISNGLHAWRKRNPTVASPDARHFRKTRAKK